MSRFERKPASTLLNGSTGDGDKNPPKPAPTNTTPQSQAENGARPTFNTTKNGNVGFTENGGYIRKVKTPGFCSCDEGTEWMAFDDSSIYVGTYATDAEAAAAAEEQITAWRHRRPR